MNATEAQILTLVKRWILGQEPNMIQVILDLDLRICPKKSSWIGAPPLGDEILRGLRPRWILELKAGVEQAAGNDLAALEY